MINASSRAAGVMTAEFKPYSLMMRQQFIDQIEKDEDKLSPNSTQCKVHGIT